MVILGTTKALPNMCQDLPLEAREGHDRRGPRLTAIGAREQRAVPREGRRHEAPAVAVDLHLPRLRPCIVPLCRPVALPQPLRRQAQVSRSLGSMRTLSKRGIPVHTMLAVLHVHMNTGFEKASPLLLPLDLHTLD